MKDLLLEQIFSSRKIHQKICFLCGEHNGMFFVTCKTLAEEGNWKTEFIKPKITKLSYILCGWCF